MELLKNFLDLILHIDKHLVELVSQYQSWTYGILFLIIFCETGLVVMPLLPGDSLLFAVGAIASKGDLNVFLVVALLSIAAIIGDTVNYWIGKVIGPRVFNSESSRWLNRKHLERTHEFYEKYGGKTIIIARFMPIIRTFAPFVAGIGKMSYGKFLLYNVVGGILWIALFTYAGYFFGEIPVVKRNFTLVIFAIIIISVMPAVIEFLRARRAGNQ
ncbi:MAG TPA: DedA family protein [Blastocatellia bacterium]|nr:DedA family protein [Blastocatellia bacterium]HMV82146.1 DedA family protein [Blastocatellia bacterium]HMX24967.1 DedA family protein [Blastocatellia bacterium]HMY73382.1 DedA family protein [Blastocatellia bacterium]HMZ19230.1 DedA family protein [Blastocatellia bacterium]